MGSFEPAPGAAPLEVVGFKIQFTQVEGDNSGSFFIEDSVGWGLSERSKLEGFRLNNLIATWIIGPLLPLNPDLTAWLIGQISGSDEVQLAFEPEARAAYVKRAAELKAPGMHLAY